MADIDEVAAVQRRLRDAGFVSIDRVAGIYDLVAIFDFDTVGRLRSQLLRLVHQQGPPHAGNVDRTVTLLHLDPDDAGTIMPPAEGQQRATVLITTPAGRHFEAQDYLRTAGALRVSQVTGIYDLVAIVDRPDEDQIEQWVRKVRADAVIERVVTLYHLSNGHSGLGNPRSSASGSAPEVSSRTSLPSATAPGSVLTSSNFA